MSAVLSQYKTGVTLMKKDANGNFKPIMQNVTQTMDKKGKTTTIYSDAGCN